MTHEPSYVVVRAALHRDKSFAEQRRAASSWGRVALLVALACSALGAKGVVSVLARNAPSLLLLELGRLAIGTAVGGMIFMVVLGTLV